MVTAKELDTLKAKVEAKKSELETIQQELNDLQFDLQEKATEFMADYGIELTRAKSTPTRKTTAGSINQKAVDIITKMIGNKQKIEIKKPEKEEIASKAGCSIQDVEATLKSKFIGYPIGKGRKGSFGLK